MSLEITPKLCQFLCTIYFTVKRSVGIIHIFCVKVTEINCWLKINPIFVTRQCYCVIVVVLWLPASNKKWYCIGWLSIWILMISCWGKIGKPHECSYFCQNNCTIFLLLWFVDSLILEANRVLLNIHDFVITMNIYISVITAIPYSFIWPINVFVLKAWVFD